MTTREKVIVTMAAAALLYGLYTTFSEPEVHDLPAGETSAATVVMINAVLTDEPADAQAITQVLANAQLPWQDNSFLIAGLDHRQETDQEKLVDIPAAVKGIVYSGYLEMAGERIAIINNAEYRPGQVVEGFAIEHISPSKIRLSRDRKEYEVALQETK